METARGVQFNLRIRRCYKKRTRDIFFSTPVDAGLSGIVNRGNQRRNAENIPGVKEISCGNQITRQLRCRRLLDAVEPESFYENFESGIEQAKRYGFFEQYRVLDGGVLTAVDGVWFQPSEKVHCGHVYI
jgi:hypothetical protein